MSLQTFAVAPVLGLLATTGKAGVALINGTQTLLTWTAPADGNMHRVLIFLQSFATAGQTGGQVNVTATDPAGNAVNLTAIANGASIGPHTPTLTTVLVQPGTAVSVVQQTALTAGGPTTVWAEFWGS